VKRRFEFDGAVTAHMTLAMRARHLSEWIRILPGPIKRRYKPRHLGGR
jgi:hypothetical protein